MGLSLPQDKQKRAIMIAIVGSIFAGAATMLIPVSVLEAITGATGLSEIIPATAAPLGDKARALIAFGAGALTLAVVALLLLRRVDDVEDNDSDDRAADIMGSERAASLKDRLPKISMPSMPWQKQDDDIRDLDDLPKLREKDIHPDAPPRMPLSADRDLADGSAAPELALQASEAIAVEPMVEPRSEPVMQESEHAEVEIPSEPIAVEPAQAEPVEQEAAATTAPETVEAVEPSEPSEPATPMTSLVEELQNAIEKRAASQEELSAVSQRMKKAMRDEERQEQPAETQVNSAPPLKAVKDTAENSDKENGEMDGALNAALETLQRMNAQAR